MNDFKTVSWFSAGVSSAVATKLIIDEIDEIIYTHIDDQHPDTMRFVKDCEEWFGKKITILQSRIKSVDHAMRLFPNQKIHGGQWAPCTDILKRRVRKEWEADQQKTLIYVWGMDCKEKDRLEKLRIAMPKFEHRAPLIEQSISKERAHQILNASGIKRPYLYDLGYHNNNCLGCCKGGIGYFNKLRIDFPEVFQKRAEMERIIGGSILKTHPPKGDKAQPIYLDELDPERGRHEGPIIDDCGIFCELEALN